MLLAATAGALALAVGAQAIASALDLDARIWVVDLALVLVMANLVAGTLFACARLFLRRSISVAVSGSMLAVILCCVCLAMPALFLALLPGESVAPDGTIVRVNHFLWGATPYTAEPVGPFFMREIVADPEPAPEPAPVSASDLVIHEDLSSLPVDEAFEKAGCRCQVTGTVASSPADGDFSFTVDDGQGVIEDGTSLQVDLSDVKVRFYGEKGLQWGMDGVVVGFAELPGADGVLRVLAIVGNDETGSAYWENTR